MELILLVVQTVIAVLLIASVLVQRSSSDGFGLGGSGGGSGLISARGQANLMTRITATLAALFMINSLVLTIITTGGSARSLIDEVEEQPSLSAPASGKEEITNKPGTVPDTAPDTQDDVKNGAEEAAPITPDEAPSQPDTPIRAPRAE
jgi:preprotein translocase subunit SecG